VLDYLIGMCGGLGSLTKCNVVRNYIRSSRCDIVVLQETKLNDLTLSYILYPHTSKSNRVILPYCLEKMLLPLMGHHAHVLCAAH
jgi:hypothetical protein